MTAKGYKQYKVLRKESLRNNMSELEVALADIEERLRETIVTKDNSLNYQYIEEPKQIENK